MEVAEFQEQPCKFPRTRNGGRNDCNKIGSNTVDHYPDDEDGEPNRGNNGGGYSGTVGGEDPDGGGPNRLRGWHHSRIIRVSRASGGKDRHSKVMTSKGLRDRRVRLSVATAIQFYDLQDRLGYDQPSKAVEWLIKAAEDSISELPSLNASFPETPKQPSGEKRAETEHGFDSAEVIEFNGEANFFQQNQKSACSSNSETSKGSGLSLSRTEIRVNRVKARERARERAAKEKDQKEGDNNDNNNNNNKSIVQNSSFTELLTGSANSPKGSVVTRGQWHPATVAMDYFGSGLMGPTPTSSMIPTFNVMGDNHTETLPHFSLVSDNIFPVAGATHQGGGNDYNLNFTISSNSSLGAGGFNRGTLQSNISHSLLPHFQRFSSLDGTNVPFFIGAAPPMENHHQHNQFSHPFDGRLQLYYGDGSRHSDQKGKGKN